MDKSTTSLLLLWNIIALTVAEDLIILPKQDSQMKPVDSATLFTCTVDVEGPIQDPGLKWFDQNNQRISDTSGRRYIESDDEKQLKLYITSIKDTDAGDYTCEGEINGNTLVKRITLEIFKDITFDHAPTLQHPVEGTDGLIECRVSGLPVPSIAWRYNGRKLPNDPRYTYVPQGLQIADVVEDDNGEYECRAEVIEDGRYKNKLIQVDVHTVPVIVQGPGTTEGVENNEVTLSCQGSGKPPPKYEFFKDDNQNPIRDTDRIDVDRDKGDVHFRPVKKEDAGQYRCRAFNDAGQVEETGQLVVIVPPFVHELLNVSMLEGHEASLVCKTYGDPAPTITWRKVGNDYDYTTGDNEGGRITVTDLTPRHSQLFFTSVSEEDTSNYTCTAENVGGTWRQNGTIVTEFMPRFDTHAPVYAWAGKTRNMTCEAKGEPLPNVDWYRYGILLKTNETYKVHKMGRFNSLQVTVREPDQTWIYGYYRCQAENKHGTGHVDVELKQAKIPDMPQAVNVKEKTPTRVTLTVVPGENDGGVPIYGYRVEYEQYAHDFEIGEIILIENLEPSTQYFFRVRSKNEVGVSNPKEFTVTTDVIQKPYPINIISEREGQYAYEYTVRWEKPRTGGMDIRQYRIQHRRVTVKADGSINEVESAYTMTEVDDDKNNPMMFYHLINLKPNQHYQVLVQADNGLGWSLEHPAFVFKTAEGDGSQAIVSRNGLGTPMIVGIIIGVLLLFLILVDISCYLMNDCGVFASLCKCGKSSGIAKEKAMEEGGESEKQPLKCDTDEEKKCAEVNEEIKEEVVEAREVEALPQAEVVPREPEEGEEEGEKDRESLRDLPPPPPDPPAGDQAPEEIQLEETVNEKTPLTEEAPKKAEPTYINEDDLKKDSGRIENAVPTETAIA